MPTLSAGQTATLSLPVDGIVTIQPNNGASRYEDPVGTIVGGDFTYVKSFGPFSAAKTVKVSCISGTCFYEQSTMIRRTPVYFADSTHTDLVAEDGTQATLDPAEMPALSAPSGSSLVGTIQSGTGAVARTVQDKDHEWKTPFDFGAKGDGVTDDQTAMSNWLAAISGGIGYVPAGVGFYVGTGNLTIADGTSIIWGGNGARVSYHGSGSCFLIRNSKNIRLDRPYIDMSGAGASAIAIDVAGAWFLNIQQPQIVGGNAGQTGIQIQTSAVGGNNYGAYLIEIHNPNFSGTGGYAINCFRTAGDGAYDVTHLNSYGGWGKGWNYGFYLRNVGTGKPGWGYVHDTGIDAFNIASCYDLVLAPGELGPNSGYGINWGTGNSGCYLIAPSKAGVGGTLGYQNNGNYTPQTFDQGKLRLYGSRSDQTYFSELNSLYAAGESMNLTVNHGGTVFKPISYGSTNGYVYNSYYTYTWQQAGTTQMQLGSSGNLWVGGQTGTGHILELAGLAEGSQKLTVFGVAQFQQSSVFGPNAANSALRIGSNSVTSRSISAGGTLNASGADYAEYEKNNGLAIAKGAIVGFKADGTLTLTYSEAVRFGVKSTDPSYVGGDTWAKEMGEPPQKPAEPHLDLPQPPAAAFASDPTPQQQAEIDAWHNQCAQLKAAAQAKYEQDLAAYEQAAAIFWPRYEALRATVDRIAYAGKVPVNVTGANPGDYILPVAAADGSITGQVVKSPDFATYLRCVGIVNSILPDGRAQIAVIVH